MVPIHAGTSQEEDGSAVCRLGSGMWGWGALRHQLRAVPWGLQHLPPEHRRCHRAVTLEG